MSALQQLEPELVLDGPDEVSDEVHFAHLKCQRGAEYVITMCGLAQDWDLAPQPFPAVDCEPCLDPTAACPVCGTLRL